MRRNLVLVAFALLVIIGLTLALDYYMEPPAVASGNPSPEVTVIKTQTAPDFSFMPINSKDNRHLSDFRGKVVLLNFWASWCAPCIIEFPKFQELAETHQDGLVILALSADTEAGAIDRFLKKTGHREQDNFLIVHDVNKAISQDLFQTIRLPETIIIDPHGNMVRKIAGDTDWTGETMHTYLKELIKSKAAP